MNAKLVASLESLARAARQSKEVLELEKALRATREALKDAGGKEPFSKLEAELATWQAKLGVIFKEPAGRQGMAKHAQYWAAEIKKIPQPKEF